MKILNAALSAFVASTLIAAPIAAQAAPVARDRSASPAKGEDFLGFGWGWIFVVLVIIGTAAIIASDSDEAAPHSP